MDTTLKNKQKEYDKNGNEIHFKDSDGYEEWSEEQKAKNDAK